MPHYNIRVLFLYFFIIKVLSTNSFWILQVIKSKEWCLYKRIDGFISQCFLFISFFFLSFCLLCKMTFQGISNVNFEQCLKKKKYPTLRLWKRKNVNGSSQHWYIFNVTIMWIWCRFFLKVCCSNLRESEKSDKY